eukprot:1861353-Prymnesium_polylepis.1
MATWILRCSLLLALLHGTAALRAPLAAVRMAVVNVDSSQRASLSKPLAVALRNTVRPQRTERIAVLPLQMRAHEPLADESAE